jgi:Fe-S oxidoreductase
VNLALLKAELLHARIRRDGLPWRDRLFSSVDALGRLGCSAPTLANLALDSLLVRSFLAKILGIAWQRPLPHYARQRFDRWFARHPRVRPAPRGRVMLWDDTFVRYHEPQIGVAAVKVLEAAGFEVVLPAGRKCCGRPAFSVGNLDEARRLGRYNLELLNQDRESMPILFLEPSCYSMFVEDYAELKLSGAQRVAGRCFLFEQFLDELLADDPAALKFKYREGNIVIHAHCHAKALHDPGFLPRLAGRMPGRHVKLLESGCCGMAGGFGFLQSKYELSLKAAQPLVQQIQSLPFGTAVAASGTSCRQQIGHLAPLRARHLAELVADALG